MQNKKKERKNKKYKRRDESRRERGEKEKMLTVSCFLFDVCFGPGHPPDTGFFFFFV